MPRSCSPRPHHHPDNGRGRNTSRQAEANWRGTPQADPQRAAASALCVMKYLSSRTGHAAARPAASRRLSLGSAVCETTPGLARDEPNGPSTDAGLSCGPARTTSRVRRRVSKSGSASRRRRSHSLSRRRAPRRRHSCPTGRRLPSSESVAHPRRGWPPLFHDPISRTYFTTPSAAPISRPHQPPLFHAPISRPPPSAAPVSRPYQPPLFHVPISRPYFTAS